MPASSYDAIPDFGLLYDSVPLYAARQDIAFYVQEAAAVRGPVLELGCGTGRILLPAARAGCTVVGLDDHDLRDFALGAKYPLVIAPFRVFQQLPLVDDQLRFLAAVAGHLAAREG